MCSRHIYTKDEAKLRLRDLIMMFGAVPRAGIRPTDLSQVMRQARGLAGLRGHSCS